MSIQFADIGIDENVDLSESNTNLRIDVLRLDKIHPVISGNKWFKLNKYLLKAKILDKKTVLTFGGAYSNHIIATAAACQLYGFKSIGIIRGEEPSLLSHTLQLAVGYGMQLKFISRDAYKTKSIEQEMRQDGSILIIPEGGYGFDGANGFTDIFKLVDLTEYTHICCAIGTGTMMAGTIKATTTLQEIIGIPVLKNFIGVNEAVNALLTKEEQAKKITYLHQYHFGGYANHNPSLIEFMNRFYTKNKIPTDFVYTGKLFFAIHDLVEKNYFSQGSKVLVIHSGGLQGNLSLPKEMLIY